MIAQSEIDFVISFWARLETQPDDPDIRALLRIAAVWNVPVASNRASADSMISSIPRESGLSFRVRAFDS